MIDVCFWCGRSKNEGEGKPEYMNYEPCDVCEKWWTKGILVIQVVDEPNGNPPVSDNLYPTNIWAVIKEEDVKKVLTDYVGLDKIMKSKTMYVNVEDWKKVINPDVRGFVRLLNT